MTIPVAFWVITTLVVAPQAHAVVRKVWDMPSPAFQAGAGVVALTFDDGPDPRWTPSILAVLRRSGVQATFFDVGRSAAAHPDLVRAEAADGHGVGSHTWDHADLTRANNFAHEVDDTSVLLAGLIGHPIACLRPPYGALNASVERQVAARGLATVLWTVDPSDYRRPGVDVIVQRVLAAARPGSVIGLHDGGGDRSQTVAALPLIIDGLRARGLRPVGMCGAPATVGIASAPASGGYRLARADAETNVGGVSEETAAPVRTLNAPIVGVASSSVPGAYWLAASDGGVFAIGGAGFFGSAPGVPPADPVVGLAATADGGGYWLVTRSGESLAFGDAPAAPSFGRPELNAPVVGVAAAGDKGYWLAGSDGGVFSFGGAPFLGSMGGQPLTAPVVGIAATPAGDGYWLVGADGGVFAFGAARFFGSAAQAPGQRVVGITATPDAAGYWLVGSGGEVRAFGDAVAPA